MVRIFGSRVRAAAIAASGDAARGPSSSVRLRASASMSVCQSASRDGAEQPGLEARQPAVAADQQVGALLADDVEQYLDRRALDDHGPDLLRTRGGRPLGRRAHGVLGRVRADDLVSVLAQRVLSTV